MIDIDVTDNIKHEVSKLIKITNKYKKWGLDIPLYKMVDNQIEYGIGIYQYSNILNYGEIPKEELLNISFPTGAYIFGDDYDIDCFKQFYSELKTVKPKYEDKMNNSLYYSVENANEAYKHYKSTYKKYIKIHEERSKNREIELLKQKLKDLTER